MYRVLYDQTVANERVEWSTLVFGASPGQGDVRGAAVRQERGGGGGAERAVPAQGGAQVLRRAERQAGGGACIHTTFTPHSHSALVHQTSRAHSLFTPFTITRLDSSVSSFTQQMKNTYFPRARLELSEDV